MITSHTEKLKALLVNPKKIVIVGHKNPDGDAVGSCLGLWHFLVNRGHEATVIMPNDYPQFLKWLPGNDSVILFEQETGAANDKLADADRQTVPARTDRARLATGRNAIRLANAA